MSAGANPYKINVPDAAIERLKKKLELATLPGETTFTDDWRYGASIGDITRLVEYWKNGYDWRRSEAELNRLPQFTTTLELDGPEEALKIHFVHQKSETTDSIPLLFIHGWPGSFLEVTKILPLLTRGHNTQNFHVVAPSVPNCGFSQRTSKPGFGILQHAEVCHKLMLRLGYDRYSKPYSFLA